MSGLLLSLWCLAICTAICTVSGQENRRRRRELQERLGRVVSGPQIVKDRDRPEVLPEFCEVCGRPMSRPVGQATVTTVHGSAAVYCCSYCLALGGLDSMVSAGELLTGDER